MGDSALVGVVVHGVLQLEDVGAGSGVNVGRVTGATLLALAVHVVLILEAAGALVLLVGGGEAYVEAVVAAGGAAEDEIVDEERAVGLSVGAATVVAAAVGSGSGKGGSEAGGSETEDSGGTHFDVVGVVVEELKSEIDCCVGCGMLCCDVVELQLRTRGSHYLIYVHL